ncbi:MAG: DUF4920 domain-containing protein [Planctomycetes bacterium]|nr:DUF4920 domain-containing protein [Planctomycetota bacterium]
MKTAITLLALCLLPLAPACNQASETAAADKAGADCSACPDALAKPATDVAADVLKKGMFLSELTPISKILAAPASFEGQRVRVVGDAVAVCETRGCWINLKSEADAAKFLRVKVEDGEIVFPMTVKGHPVEVEGVVQKVVISVEDYRAILKARADQKGESFDPATVTEPKVSWQLKGLGAKFDA